MRPSFDRSLYILLFIILILCISYTQQHNIKPQLHQQKQQHRPADAKQETDAAIAGVITLTSTSTATSSAQQWSRSHTSAKDFNHLMQVKGAQQAYWGDAEDVVKEDEQEEDEENLVHPKDDNKLLKPLRRQQQQNKKQEQRKHFEIDSSEEEEFPNDHHHVNKEICANNCKAKSSLTPKIHSKFSGLSRYQSTKVKVPPNNSKARHSFNHHKSQKDDDRTILHTYSSVSAASLSSMLSTFPVTRHLNSSSETFSDFAPAPDSAAVASRHVSGGSSSSLKQPSQMPLMNERYVYSETSKTPAKLSLRALTKKEHQRIHVAHKLQHKEVMTHRENKEQNNSNNNNNNNKNNNNNNNNNKKKLWQNRESRQSESFKYDEDLIEAEETIKQRSRRETEEIESKQSLEDHSNNKSTEIQHLHEHSTTTNAATETTNTFTAKKPKILYLNETIIKSSLTPLTTTSASTSSLASKSKRSHSNIRIPVEVLNHPKEPMVIIDEVEEFEGAAERQREYSQMGVIGAPDDKSEDYSHDEEPRALPLRPVLPNPYDTEEMSVVYAEQHSEIRLMCEVDLDISSSMWYKNGQVVHAMDRTTRVTDYRFIKEANGALTITNVMLEDDGKWQCEAENTRHYSENARPVKLVVLDRPKPPYLLIDGRRLDAGNIFVPVKENSELNLACISEGGNPKPTLTWELLLSAGVDRHAQKVSAEVLELEEIKNEKVEIDKNTYKINSGAKSEARLPAVFRAHHNARILCVMEHPTLKIRQNASLLLDVQYTPSFAISRTPGFGYPLREGIEVSLKCDVDSNPPSTPRWQKDDGEPPVPQPGDGFLNFTSIRREHSGWYKCTSRHLNYQYSSIGYYLSVRYDSVDVTSEPDDQDISVAAASHNPNKGQLEVQLGGAVTLQCPQGSLGCWSHLDPVTARLRGLGHGLSSPTGQVSLKDVVYQDAGTYKCIGQSPVNKKKLEVLQTVGVTVKGNPTVVARNSTPVAYPGSPLHLSVEFCANPPAHAARWLHGDRVYTPGNQYGSTVLAYGFTDLPTPFCKEARLTYVSMHERVPRTFYFIVSSPGGVAEAVIKVNFTMRYRPLSNIIDYEEEELSEPEEIHFPVFGSSVNLIRPLNRFLVAAIVWFIYKT